MIYHKAIRTQNLSSLLRYQKLIAQDSIQTPNSYQNMCRFALFNVKCKCCSVSFEEHQLKLIFNQFDSDKDGLLNKQELKNAFSYLGSRVPEWRTQRALSYADENGDGYIDDKELEKIINYAYRQNYKFR